MNLRNLFGNKKLIIGAIIGGIIVGIAIILFLLPVFLTSASIYCENHGDCWPSQFGCANNSLATQIRYLYTFGLIIDYIPVPCGCEDNVCKYVGDISTFSIIDCKDVLYGLKDKCFEDLLPGVEDSNICGQLLKNTETEIYGIECYFNIVDIFENDEKIRICEGIEALWLRDSCYAKIVKDIKDETICLRISSEVLREKCYENLEN